MKLDTAKGVRDFPPQEKIIRQQIIDSLKSVFERYGYSPLETPIIERYEVLSAKFAAGQESDALKETFKFEDQGRRKLGLRFDLTVPLSRFVGMNPKTKMPFKRYEIGRTYRDGPIKLGRYREFWQCDVDVVGCKDVLADAEIIKLSLDVFKELGFDAYIELNNRKLLNGILEYAKVPKQKKEQAERKEESTKSQIEFEEEVEEKVGKKFGITDYDPQNKTIGIDEETGESVKIPNEDYDKYKTAVEEYSKLNLPPDQLKKLLDDMGVESDRVRFEYVSASEGQKFAQVVTDFVSVLKNLGPSPLKETK